jgi:hypothetical protein
LTPDHKRIRLFYLFFILPSAFAVINPAMLFFMGPGICGVCFVQLNISLLGPWLLIRSDQREVG